MHKRLLQRWIPAGVGLVLMVLANAGPAHALNFEFNEDTSLDFDVSLKYSAAWRAKNADDFLVDGDPAHPFRLGSAGDGNFDSGDMINNRYSAVFDIDFQYKDYGIFVRPRFYYDFAYDEDADQSNPYKFLQETQDLHRDKAEFLDAFVYGSFEVGGRDITLRVGEQVVSWGESLFILNGISAGMSPIDATAANIPGVELKDLFLPVGQVMGRVSLTDNMTLEAFYQWEWDKTRVDEAGAYFSTTNLLDDAIRDTELSFLRGGDNDPDDDGQWGVSMRYVAEGLNDAEIGLYYINYHEKLPYVVDTVPLLLAFAGIPTGNPFILPGSGTYHLDYADNVQLYGASVSGMLGDTNVAMEVSYRKDLSVQVKQDDLPINTPSPMLNMVHGLVNTSERNWENEEVDVLQVQMSAISVFQQTSFYDNLTVTGEVGINRVVGGRDGKKLWNDRTAWGGTVKAAFDYFQVLPNLDLNVPITYNFNPNGVSSVLGTFVEDADRIGVALDFTYKQNYKLGIGYTDYLNDVEENNKADRDFVSLNMKYTF